MIDTSFTCIFASAHTDEHEKDVQCHFTSAFAALEESVSIKIDNGPAHTGALIFRSK